MASSNGIFSPLAYTPTYALRSTISAMPPLSPGAKRLLPPYAAGSRS